MHIPGLFSGTPSTSLVTLRFPEPEASVAPKVTPSVFAKVPQPGTIFCRYVDL